MEMQRRTVLQAGGVLAAGAVVAACSTGGAETASGSGASAAVTTPSAAPAPTAAPSVASAGAGAAVQVADVPVGGGVILDEPAVVVTQPAQGDVKAFTAICPHQGCLVSEVADNEIVCPCHGSTFSAVDGSVIVGPATQGLAPVAVAVEGGSVILG